MTAIRCLQPPGVEQSLLEIFIHGVGKTLERQRELVIGRQRQGGIGPGNRPLKIGQQQTGATCAMDKLQVAGLCCKLFLQACQLLVNPETLAKYSTGKVDGLMDGR